MSLPRLSGSEAQALSAIARRAITLPVQGWSDDAAPPLLSLGSVGDASSPLDGVAALRLAIEWGGSRLWLDLPASACDAWLGARLASVDLSALAPVWREAALEDATEWLCETLSAAGRGQAQQVGNGPTDGAAPAGAKHRFLLTLAWDEPAEVIHGLLHADSLALLLVAGLLPAAGAEPEPALPRWAHLPMPLRLTVGETDLPLSDLRALRAGDVVMVTRPYIDGEQRLQLRCGQPGSPGWGFAARLDDNTLTLLDHPMSTQDLADPDVASSDDAPLATLDELRIRLSFDVGDKTISLAELERLQPGETIRLDRPTTGYVLVRANGSLIGSGHLVEIDGRLGVCLDRLTPPATPPALAQDTDGPQQ